jgi:hypothetical protein
MTPDPIRELLRAGRLGIGIVGGPQHGHEQFDLEERAGGPDNGRFLAGVVDKQFLARPVDLPHRQPSAGEPPAVDVAKLRVAVAVGMAFEVFEVQ